MAAEQATSAQQRIIHRENSNIALNVNRFMSLARRCYASSPKKTPSRKQTRLVRTRIAKQSAKTCRGFRTVDVRFLRLRRGSLPKLDNSHKGHSQFQCEAKTRTRSRLG